MNIDNDFVSLVFKKRCFLIKIQCVWQVTDYYWLLLDL